MKKIACLFTIEPHQIWNISISVFECLKRMGYDVKLYSTLENGNFTYKNYYKLLNDVKNGYDPDIVWNLDFGLFSPPEMRKQLIPNAYWIMESGDDPQNYHLNSRKLLGKNFDLILSPDVRTTTFYRLNGENAFWWPHFADFELFDGVQQEPLFDAVTSRSITEPFFRKIKNKLGDRFEARNQPKIFQGKQHAYHLKKGKIVIQNSKYKEITRRIFEGMLANRMVLTDRVSEETKINQLFRENHDIVYFDSLDDCIDKINYYSENEEERLKIAKNGFEKVKKNHTVNQRVEKIFDYLKGKL